MRRNLLDQITDATGLPPKVIRRELEALLRKAGKTPEQASLDDIRHALALYLQDVLVGAKSTLN